MRKNLWPTQKAIKKIVFLTNGFLLVDDDWVSFAASFRCSFTSTTVLSAEKPILLVVPYPPWSYLLLGISSSRERMTPFVHRRHLSPPSPAPASSHRRQLPVPSSSSLLRSSLPLGESIFCPVTDHLQQSSSILYLLWGMICVRVSCVESIAGLES